MTFPDPSGPEVDLPGYAVADWLRYRQLEVLVNHWERPGWTPGRRSYHWFVTFDAVPDLYSLVDRCQKWLRDLPNLDLVPLSGLHLTVQGAGFTDEVTPAQADRIVAEARPYLSQIPPFTVMIGPLAGSAGAVRFSVGPREPIGRLREAVRAGVAAVRGAENVPTRSSPYVPHVGIAYNNRRVDAEPVRQRVRRMRSELPVTTLVNAIDFVELRREGRRYGWTTLHRIPLRGSR